MSSKGGLPTLEELREPPAAADPEEVASIARQGIIGQCLEGALKDVMDAQDKEDACASKTLKLEPHMVDNVMKEFGRSVAKTQWTKTKPNAPPAALLRGRLDHYNRFQGKWRIIVRDAKWKRRAVLEPTRKKTNQPPLWEALKTRETRDIGMSLQILAHDDLC